VYGALGHRFEALAGAPWAAFLRDELLEPLGMASTTLGPTAPPDDAAVPYARTEAMPRADLAPVAAAGSMRSSAADLGRWMGLHLAEGLTPEGEPLLYGDSVRRLHRPETPVDAPNPGLFLGLEWLLGEPVRYGLGWFLGSVAGEPVAFHPGFIDGFSTALALFPRQRLGVAVLTNLNLSGAPGRLIEVVAKKLAPELDSARDEPPAPEEGAPEAAAPPSPSSTVVPAAAVASPGAYESPAYGRATIERRGESFVLRFAGHDRPLSWSSATSATFTVPWVGMELPLSVDFEVEGETSKSLSIPLGMDPRSTPERFVRVAP
jgi:hypothetical protein